MKRANPQKKICPIEKTISQDFSLDMKPAIYSRYLRFLIDNFKPQSTPFMWLSGFTIQDSIIHFRSTGQNALFYHFFSFVIFHN